MRVDGRLAEVLVGLAGCTGSVLGDLSDEHERWPVYLAACKRSQCHDLLLSSVALEPDPSLASGVVLQMLGNLPPAERQTWITQLPSPAGRDYATRRANELAIFQSSEVTRLLVDEDVQDSWSDWLQLLLAELSTEPAVLRRLADKGRTKRVRRYATQSLATVERGLP